MENKQKKEWSQPVKLILLGILLLVISLVFVVTATLIAPLGWLEGIVIWLGVMSIMIAGGGFIALAIGIIDKFNDDY